MALPAGRYGVTKNQLLKIKKLPMNTIKLIEELTEKFDLLGSAAFKDSVSVVTESSDLVESGAVYSALQGKTNNTVITNNFETENYSRAYAVGEHFMNDGVLRTVKATVASGDEITDNNSFVDTVTGKKTITVTPEAGVTYGTNKCVISNNIIVINIVIDPRSFSDSSATLVGTVESTYKPNVEIYSAGVSANGIPCRVAVNTSGQIFVRPETSITNSKVGFTIVYTI